MDSIANCTKVGKVLANMLEEVKVFAHQWLFLVFDYFV